MTRVDGMDALAALMRQQVRSLRRPVVERAGKPPVDAKRAGTRASRARDDLAALVSRRVKALDRTDKDARRKAFRIFLEAVMQSELGEDVINDGAFHGLVDGVVDQMSADAELAQMMERAATLLLSAAD